MAESSEWVVWSDRVKTPSDFRNARPINAMKQRRGRASEPLRGKRQDVTFRPGSCRLWRGPSVRLRGTVRVVGRLGTWDVRAGGVLVTCLSSRSPTLVG